MNDDVRNKISGTAIPVRGNDIDTDRIIPARYLRTVVFEGLGEHAFEDDRAQLKEAGKLHSFDDPRFSGASVLVVNKNFGCGSSREHAPQAIMRWGKGIRAIIGEGFAEIFFGNCTALGIPCAKASEASVEAIQAAVNQDPSAVVEVDMEARRIRVSGQSFDFEIPDGVRKAFLDGRWDSTTELLEAKDQIRATAGTLPYVGGF